jgi:hypothetical protein
MKQNLSSYVTNVVRLSRAALPGVKLKAVARYDVNTISSMMSMVHLHQIGPRSVRMHVFTEPPHYMHPELVQTNNIFSISALSTVFLHVFGRCALGGSITRNIFRIECSH